MKLPLSLAFLLAFPSDVADAKEKKLRGILPIWSMADEDGCLQTTFNVAALKLTKWGTGIDGAKTGNVTRATCIDKGFPVETPPFFGQYHDMPAVVKGAYTGVTWWKQQNETNSNEYKVTCLPLGTRGCSDTTPCCGDLVCNGHMSGPESFCTVASKKSVAWK
jgi:hypothetical protein